MTMKICSGGGGDDAQQSRFLHFSFVRNRRKWRQDIKANTRERDDYIEKELIDFCYFA